MPNPHLIKAFTAETAVSPCRIVKFGSADGAVVQGAAVTDLLIGVADSLGQSTAGDRIDVVLSGIADVEFGGNVTRGQLVTADSNGKAVAAAPAAGVNNQVIGRALVSAASGDIGPILIAPGSMQGA